MTYDEILAALATYNQARGCSLALPTADQWERACKAGSTTLFHWGDSLDPAIAGAYAVTSATQPQPVDPSAYVLPGAGSLGLSNTAPQTRPKGKGKGPQKSTPKPAGKRGR